MCKPFRNVIGFVVAIRQFLGEILPIRGRAFAQVNDDIQYGSLRTENNFGVLVRRCLEMHTSDHLFPGDGKIAFFQGEVNAVFVQRGCMEGLGEVAACIIKRGQCDDPCFRKCGV